MAYERIAVDPAKMTGLPCIRDTRVTFGGSPWLPRIALPALPAA